MSSDGWSYVIRTDQGDRVYPLPAAPGGTEKVAAWGGYFWMRTADGAIYEYDGSTEVFRKENSPPRAVLRALRGGEVMLIKREGKKMLRFEVMTDLVYAHDWRVEGIDYDNDGVCYIAIFSGPAAKERAEEYASFKNETTRP